MTMAKNMIEEPYDVAPVGRPSLDQAMITRRALMMSAGVLALSAPAIASMSTKARRGAIKPMPMQSVRLKPSIYADAVEANRRYLLALESDRLLHNFRRSAGLKPKAEVYGGWEALGIAGHSLGHYLSACALMHAQTGDEQIRARIRYIVSELAECQKAHGDGYIGGTTVKRDEREVDGKIIFEELRRGDIRSTGFDLNGGWVPLYTWHKVQAGLIDAERLAGVVEARPVLVGMSDYLATIIEGISDDQLQKILATEHGGLNESYAETYALTGNPRYLRLAERIRHRAVLDPLTRGQDILPGLHANTQIPKLIGLARLHELTGNRDHAAAASFFHRTVVDRHSYVIGGNSEREHFGEPGKLSTRITDRTCETCNSYNMLKLTRHVYSWSGDASLFDYYERTHLNHIMAHQRPDTGMLVYFMPLGAGAKRIYSDPENSFWCCVGSGIESHAKHGDSIYWQDGETLYVNLYIASSLEWKEGGLSLDLDTRLPFSDTALLTMRRAPRSRRTIAMRIPGWAAGADVRLNDKPVRVAPARGYVRISRRWHVGDRLSLRLPMALKVEPTPDNPNVFAFTHGPVVLAADLGPGDRPWEGPDPALVAETASASLEPVDTAQHVFRAAAARPRPLTLKPFFNQYDRRTAVYFPLFTQAQWQVEEASFLAAQKDKAALEARTVDILHLGEMQPERDHQLSTNHSQPVSYGGRSGRQIWWGNGNFAEFTLAVPRGAATLRILYWGEDVKKNFEISIDGRTLARERREGDPVNRFVAVDYALPPELVPSKDKVTVRIETQGSDATVYEVRMLRAENPASV
jgi:DUF1680 family protein